jgi:hypothetical protein
MPKKAKRKVGSGRTKGSVSFVVVPLKQLNKRFAPNQRVIISRRWAEMLLIKGEKIAATPQALQALAQ